MPRRWRLPVPTLAMAWLVMSAPTLAAVARPTGAAAARPTRAAASGRGDTCGPSGAKAVSQSSTIRVYRVPSHSQLAPLLEYACWRATGRTLLLGYSGTSELLAAHVSHITLAAPLVPSSASSVLAWEQTTVTATSSSQSLMSGNVRSGRLIHQTAPRTEGQLRANRFIVTPTGSLAWIGKGGALESAGQNSGAFGVWAFGPHGQQLLAPAHEAEAPQVQLGWADGTLSWSIGGQPATAPLP
jgi:hypothetical protein